MVFPSYVRDSMSGEVQTVPILSSTEVMANYDLLGQLIRTKNGNVNFSVPILNVMLHSPLFFINVPFAALILIRLANNSVCISQGSFCNFQEITHIYMLLSPIVSDELSFQFE